MTQNYTPELKMKIIRLYEEGNSSYRTLAAEYGVSRSSISKWYREYSFGSQTSPETREKCDSTDEILCLKKENEDLKVEVVFLKKVVAFFAKEIG